MISTDPYVSSSVSKISDEEEKFVLSRRRAAILIFLLGVVVLGLLFLVRLDVDIKQGQVGERANIIEKTTPIFEDPVRTAVNGVNKEEVAGDLREESLYLPMGAALHEHQRDPRLLLGSLFGSLYGRTDYVRK